MVVEPGLADADADDAAARSAVSVFRPDSALHRKSFGSSSASFNFLSQRFFQRKNNDSSNFGQNLNRLFSEGKTVFKFFGSVFFPSEASVVIFLYRQPLELLFRFRLAAVTLALSLCYISASMIDTKRDVGFKNTVIKSIEKS